MIVVGDHIIDVAGADAVAERADIGAGKHISKGTVRSKAAIAGAIAGDIGLEDAASISGRTQRERNRQRAVKMADHAQAKVIREVHGAAKRDLMLAVEPVRP